MKKLIMICSMISLFIAGLQPIAHADFFEGWQQGAAIGRSVREARERQRIMDGNQTQDIFVDKNYNFSKIRKIVLMVLVANGSEQYIDDPYIARTYENDLIEAFKGKEITLESSNIANQKLLSAYPTWASMSDNLRIEALRKFLSDNYQATLTVTFGSYSQTNESNVAVRYLIKDTATTQDIFNDLDCRIHVLNKTKRKLLDNMTSKFVNEFFKAVNKSKNN